VARVDQDAQGSAADPAGPRDDVAWARALPSAIAQDIVNDGLPDFLRARPSLIVSSPEVPMPLTDDAKAEILATGGSDDSLKKLAELVRAAHTGK
jgi:hypothetical protein